MEPISQRRSFRSTNITRYAHLPLPEYTKGWGKDLQRPTTHPPKPPDAAIDPAHIFSFPRHPKTNEPGEFFVVARKCRRCERGRYVCSRGEVCGRCRDAGKEEECIIEDGWIKLPVARRGNRSPPRGTRKPKTSRDTGRSNFGAATAPARPQKRGRLQRELRNLRRNSWQDLPQPDTFKSNGDAQHDNAESSILLPSASAAPSSLSTPFIPRRNQQSASGRRGTTDAGQRAMRTKVRDGAVRQPKTKEPVLADQGSDAASSSNKERSPVFEQITAGIAPLTPLTSPLDSGPPVAGPATNTGSKTADKPTTTNLHVNGSNEPAVSRRSPLGDVAASEIVPRGEPSASDARRGRSDVPKVLPSHDPRSASTSRRAKTPSHPTIQNRPRTPSPLSLPSSDLTPEEDPATPRTRRSVSSSHSRSPSPPRRSSRLVKKRARESLPMAQFLELYPPSPSPESSSDEAEPEEDEESHVEYNAEEQEEGDDGSRAHTAQPETSSVTANGETSLVNGDANTQPSAAEQQNFAEQHISTPREDEHVDEPGNLADEPPSSPLIVNASLKCALPAPIAFPDSESTSSTHSHPIDDSSEQNDISPTYRLKFGDAAPAAEGSFHLSAASTWDRPSSPGSSGDSDDSDEWGFTLSHPSVRGNFGVEDHSNLVPARLENAVGPPAEPTTSNAQPKRTVATAKQARGGVHAGTKRKHESSRAKGTMRGGGQHHAVSGTARKSKEREVTEAPHESANAQTALIMSLLSRHQAQVQALLAEEHLDEAVRLPDVSAAVETDASDDDDSEDEDEVLRYLKRPRRQHGTPDPSPLDSARASPEPESQRASPEPARFSPKILGEDSALIQVDGTLFHLSKSSLAADSEYFAGLFESQPNGLPSDHVSPSLDTRRITAVQGISAKDFQTTMLALSDMQTFEETVPNFQVLVAVFCVSRTLKFTRLDTIATLKLTSMWADDVTQLSLRLPFAAETIILAREYGLPGVLKRAFYELLRTEGFGQYHVVQPNGSHSHPPITHNRDTSIDDYSTTQLKGSELVGKAKLPHADMVRLTLTREKLQHVWAQLAASAPSTAQFPCPLRRNHIDDERYELCQRAQEHSKSIWMDSVITSGVFISSINDPIGGLERLAGMKWEAVGYCDACVSARREFWIGKREEIWNALGPWLGL